MNLSETTRNGLAHVADFAAFLWRLANLATALVIYTLATYGAGLLFVLHDDLTGTTAEEVLTTLRTGSAVHLQIAATIAVMSYLLACIVVGRPLLRLPSRWGAAIDNRITRLDERLTATIKRLLRRA